MKKISLSFLLILSLIVPTLAFAGYIFEQEIDTGKQKMSIVYSVQGNHKRIDSYQNGKLVTSQIYSPKYKSPLLLMHQNKQYMIQQPFSISKEMQKMMRETKDPKKAQTPKQTINPNDFKVKTTSKKKTIGKYKTRLVQILYKGTPFQEQWVTKDIPKEAIDAMNSFTRDEKLFPDSTGKTTKTMKSLKGKVEGYGFPILTISKYDKSTKGLHAWGTSTGMDVPKEVRIEMKRIQKKKLPKKDFEPPKDYKEMKIPTIK